MEKLEYQEGRTELESLGEFALIQRLTDGFRCVNKSTVTGVGDDCAVLGTGKRKTVVTTDMLVEGIHFDMTYTPLRHLGYKAVAVNLSDICAMNATPRQVLVSVAVSNRFSVEALEELYAGIRLCCERYDVDLVGGDTSSSRIGMVISVTAIGEVDKELITYRHGAQLHDLICVSGDLGSAYSGLLVLEREKVTFQADPNFKPDLDSYDYVLERYLKPEPRADIVKRHYRTYNDYYVTCHYPMSTYDIQRITRNRVTKLSSQTQHYTFDRKLDKFQDRFRRQFTAVYRYLIRE